MSSEESDNEVKPSKGPQAQKVEAELAEDQAEKH